MTLDENLKKYKSSSDTIEYVDILKAYRKRKNNTEKYEDFVSYIVNLYYKYCVYNDELPKHIESWLSKKDIVSIMKLLKKSFNTSASSSNEYGLVIYPKFMQKKDTTLPSFKDGVVQ